MLGGKPRYQLCPLLPQGCVFNLLLCPGLQSLNNQLTANDGAGTAFEPRLSILQPAFP